MNVLTFFVEFIAHFLVQAGTFQQLQAMLQHLLDHATKMIMYHCLCVSENHHTLNSKI